MPERFSVIIASYNQARFLRGAVASIMNQSLQDFEVIIVDDGSTDGSRELIEELQKQHPDRIKAAFHKHRRNRGIACTYELGISLARGKYLAFLEPDDLWSPGYLESKASVFDTKREVDVVFSPYKILREGRWGREMSLRQWLLHRKIPKERGFDNFPNLLISNNIATFSCFTVRRQAVSDLPTVYSRRIFIFDWWLLLLLSSRGLFYKDTHSHTVWRQHTDSAMRNRSFQALKKELIDFHRSTFHYFRENIDTLNASRQAHLLREFEKLPLFIAYYRSPRPKHFTRLFIKYPVGALRMLVSHFVNSRKFPG